MTEDRSGEGWIRHGTGWGWQEADRPGREDHADEPRDVPDGGADGGAEDRADWGPRDEDVAESTDDSEAGVDDAR